jgi:hypothetical protein
MTIRRIKTEPLVAADVGKWCVLDPVMISMFCTKPWEITGVANKRVYLKRTKLDRDGFSEIQEKYVMSKTVIYVCDTEADALWLSQLSDEQYRELNKMDKEIRAKYQKIIQDVIDADQQTR